MSNPTTPFSWQMPTATDLVTDLPADFEVFGQAVATSMGDLLGGSSGYILSKNSATDMDFVWIANDQGDITGITAGTGITVTSPTGPVPIVSINTAVTADLTTAQTLTNKTLTSPALTTPTVSTLTTNGDLVYGTGSGALARLGIGSTGQILTVAAGLPSWATPSSGNLVGCRVTNSAVVSIPNTTVTSLTFNTETYDTDAFHSTSSNTDRITIPAGKAGYYLINYNINYAANATGFRNNAIKLNGGSTIDAVAYIKGFSDDANSLAGTTVYYLSVADYVSLSTYQNSGGALNTEATGRTYFEVIRMGS